MQNRDVCIKGREKSGLPVVPILHKLRFLPQASSSASKALTASEKIDIRVGKIVKAEVFKEAKKPAYKLEVDLGPLGVKRSSARITRAYNPEDLVGRQVVCVVNFSPKQIGPFVSEVLVMGSYSAQGVVLLRPDFVVKSGDKIG